MDPPTANVTDRSFPFLDLPPELRVMVYERIPREVNQTRLFICEGGQVPRTSNSYGKLNTTLVSHSTSTAILATCRVISIEANNIVKATMQNWVADQGIAFISNMIDGTVEILIRCIISRYRRIAKDERVHEGCATDESGLWIYSQDSYEFGKDWLFQECPDTAITRQLTHLADKFQKLSSPSTYLNYHRAHNLYRHHQAFEENLPDILKFIDHAARILLWYNRYMQSLDASVMPFMPIRIVVQHTYRLFRTFYPRGVARIVRREGLLQEGGQDLKRTTNALLSGYGELCRAYRLNLVIAGWVCNKMGLRKSVVPSQPANYRHPTQPDQYQFLPPMSRKMWEEQWFA
ncbi:hypothetical protein K491DRAFT_684224 [Lophiostoma macrostomum CBS 122681]|uniref:Uncharacterized protein n=1 Tax=Lophiostoma macrostomum CBS 122681 TaxID=1314788 RepID=A0A6A6SQZ9_9PLEO|nr:hypothetical protein K491DRAFT_684224 [Lophiostoma macrostomum CBS 122681]